jgi:type IV secretory pathway VirB10-like protein
MEPLSALAQLSVPSGDENSKAAADAFSGEFGQTTASLIQEGLGLEPRVYIKRGTRMNISILTDIWFKEPKKHKVEVVSLKSVS